MAKYRTQRQAYWDRQRNAAVAKLIGVLVGLPVVFAATATAVKAIVRSVAGLASPARSLEVQTFATIANVMIGLVLVIATCFYAWVTRATLRELTETRRVARRPMLLVTAKAPQLVRHNRVVMFHAVLDFLNTGVAIAVRTVASVTTPQYAPDAPDDVWFHPSRSLTGTIREIPPVLAPGAHTEHEIAHLTSIEQLPNGNIHSFMQVVAIFEDLDLNQYKLVQEYDLFSHGADRLGWTLRYERLSMRTSEKRDSVRDSEQRSEYLDRRTSVVLYERSDFIF